MNPYIPCYKVGGIHQPLNDNTFSPYAVIKRDGGQVEKYQFLNGWGASVASHSGSYGGEEGLFEIITISPSGELEDGTLKGYLSKEDMYEELIEISTINPHNSHSGLL